MASLINQSKGEIGWLTRDGGFFNIAIFYSVSDTDLGPDNYNPWRLTELKIPTN